MPLSWSVTVNVAATAESSKFTAIPKQAGWKLDPGAAYVHITTNNTIEGTEWKALPEVGDAPLGHEQRRGHRFRVDQVDRAGQRVTGDHVGGGHGQRAGVGETAVRHGVGEAVLHRFAVVERELKGRVETRFAPEGLSCAMRVPLSNRIRVLRPA